MVKKTSVFETEFCMKQKPIRNSVLRIGSRQFFRRAFITYNTSLITEFARFL